MKAPVLLFALLIAALPALAVDTGAAAPTPAASVDHLAKARTAIAAKDWNVAQRELAVALKEQPQNADVHNLLGYTYRKRPSPDMAKAYEHYAIALKLDPNHKGAHEYIGEAYLQDKRLPDAELHLVALQKICGGTTCEEYQDLAEAIADYKRRN